MNFCQRHDLVTVTNCAEPGSHRSRGFPSAHPLKSALSCCRKFTSTIHRIAIPSCNEISQQNNNCLETRFNANLMKIESISGMIRIERTVSFKWHNSKCNRVANCTARNHMNHSIRSFLSSFSYSWHLNVHNTCYWKDFGHSLPLWLDLVDK